MSERVVRVWCGESNKVGSGYRVDSCHVLTARHVVDDAQSCQVRLDGESDYRAAKITWRGHDSVDVAVLELIDESPPLADRDPIWAACRWVDGECRAAGYPAFLDFEDGPEREDFVGQLAPRAGIEHGRVHAAGSWADSRAPEQWGGMSGAALFSGGHLIGVVTDAMADRLLAYPVSKLFEDEAFRQTFPEFRFDDTVLWPVADQPAIRHLRAWTKRRTGTLERPPSELLLAHNEVVPFDDSLRDRELEILKTFTVERGPAMLVFIGPAGAGKTRLLIEWCARTRARGWLAGFVESGHPDLARVTEGETPRLLVVDYPEGRVSEVVALCRRAHAAVASVRLVLLARSKGPWFDELRQEVDGGMVTSACWEELGMLNDAQRQRTYQRARVAFTGAGVDPDEVRPEDVARDELPLFAHMRALLRAHGERKVLEQPQHVLARVLDHERKHWRAQLGRLLDRTPSPAMLWDLDRVLAAVVLFGGIDGPLGDLLRWLRPSLTEREQEVFANCIVVLYRRGTRVMPLQPDSLGEQLVLEVISRAAELDGASGVEWWLRLPIDERSPKGSIGRTLTVLTRLVDSEIEAACEWLRAFVESRCEAWMQACVDQREQADPRGHELAAAIRALDDVELAKHLHRGLPTATVELLQLRVEVAQVLLRHAPQDPSDASLSERARLLTFLGMSLSAAGQREEALAVTQEAMEKHQELTKGRLDAFKPDRVMALSNLGAMLSLVGRREEALEETEEAVQHFRELARWTPDVFDPHLAMALNNLGLNLSSLGRREAALAAAQEAVEKYRELANGKLDAFESDLAMALNNLATMLSSLGRPEEALAVTQDAVDRYRVLAKRRPDAFESDLAVALSNLGIRLHSLGRYEEALIAAREAVERQRELVKGEPDVFEHDLASALSNLGISLSWLGRHEEALPATQEAVEKYRELAKRRPDVFEHELATALNNRGATFRSLGREEEALAVTQEAVEKYRQLAEARPDVFHLELARALLNLGINLSSLGKESLDEAGGRGEKALAATEEAVGICRQLAKERSGAFEPDLPSALYHLGAMLGSMGRLDEALVATQEAVEKYRELVKERPDAFQLDFARSLAVLGVIQHESGSYPQSLASLAEGLRFLILHYRRLQSDRDPLFKVIINVLRMTCEAGGLPVPTDLRPWVEGRRKPSDRSN